jgi:alkaline phosphatase D
MKESTAETLIKAGYGPETPIYRYAVTELDATLRAGDPSIIHADTSNHGFTILELGDASVSVVQHLVPPDATKLAYDQAASVRTRFSEKRFVIESGKVRSV